MAINKRLSVYRASVDETESCLEKTILLKYRGHSFYWRNRLKYCIYFYFYSIYSLWEWDQYHMPTVVISRSASTLAPTVPRHHLHPQTQGRAELYNL